MCCINKQSGFGIFARREHRRLESGATTDHLSNDDDEFVSYLSGLILYTL